MKREYVPAVIALELEKAGTHEIVGWEEISDLSFPRTAIVVRLETKDKEETA